MDPIDARSADAEKVEWLLILLVDEFFDSVGPLDEPY
jgi:hypothetical protein